MIHNARTIGLRQIQQLSKTHFPEILGLIRKEIDEENERLILEVSRNRHERVLAGFAPLKAELSPIKGKIDAKLEHIQQHIDTTKVEVAYRGVKLCEEALKDIKLDYEKFKESTNAKLESHDKKFATVKKINQTFVELFKIVNENK